MRERRLYALSNEALELVTEYSKVLGFTKSSFVDYAIRHLSYDIKNDRPLRVLNSVEPKIDEIETSQE